MSLCGSVDQLELHKINPLKIENRKTFKGDYNRTTITLCRECHKSTDESSIGRKNKYKDIYLGKLNP